MRFQTENYEPLAGRVPAWEFQPLYLSGLRAGQTVTVQSSLETPTGPWLAVQTFETGNAGVVELGAGVDILDPGWMWWSVAPMPPAGGLSRAAIEAGYELAPQIGPLDALHYTLTAETDNGERIETTCIRERLPQTVTVAEVSEGRLRGKYFAPTNGDPVASVLVLGGSEGGITEGRAAALAAEGFGALALAYFGYADLPKHAESISLELFHDGVCWLRARTNGGKCAVWGGSRGSEAALMTAAIWPDEIAAIIGWVPTHLLHAGFDMSGGEDFSLSHRSMWTLHGDPLPAGHKLALSEDLLAARRSGYSEPPGHQYSNEYLAAWRSVPLGDECEIPVERITAPILLISAEDDQLWPSTYGSDRLIERLHRFGKKEQARHVVLPNCGHAIGMPNEPRPHSNTAFWTDGYSGVDGGFIDNGGSPETNAAGARQGWAEALAFLKSTLA
ncbi:MAG: acyl-CoA thioester hydrolase/BAAT C-terminal domain-containing protein [Pseudomonadota bacterium]